VPCHTKRQCKDSSKKSNRQDDCEKKIAKKMTCSLLKKEIYLVGKIIFCNFAAEMVALPPKSGGVKEHQKGIR